MGYTVSAIVSIVGFCLIGTLALAVAGWLSIGRMQHWVVAAAGVIDPSPFEDADGKPIYNSDGKVMKGPNYWTPTEKLKELLDNEDYSKDFADTFLHG